MSHTHRFFNMYLTATISVALVLIIIGMEGILILSTQSLIQRIKENITVTLIIQPEADTAAINNKLKSNPYVLRYDYISPEQALREHIAYLGEDPTHFLGYNPLRASYEIHVCGAYAHPDSIKAIAQEWENYSGIERVDYQQELLTFINRNINGISIILATVAIILLLIAIALIINTIRLHIYSKRFLIKTMTLVGATPWIIKAPIVKKNIWIGIMAATLATFALSGLMYLAQVRMGILILIPSWQNIAYIMGLIYGIGICITFLASIGVTNRYIRMETNTMYEI